MNEYNENIKDDCINYRVYASDINTYLQNKLNMAIYQDEKMYLLYNTKIDVTSINCKDLSINSNDDYWLLLVKMPVSFIEEYDIDAYDLLSSVGDGHQLISFKPCIETVLSPYYFNKNYNVIKNNAYNDRIEKYNTAKHHQDYPRVVSIDGIKHAEILIDPIKILSDIVNISKHGKSIFKTKYTVVKTSNGEYLYDISFYIDSN